MAPSAAACRSASSTAGAKLRIGVAETATRSAPRRPSSPKSGVSVAPTVVGSGSPATGPHTRKSNGGTPSSVRSIPNTSQTVPNSNGVTCGSTSTATVDNMSPV